MLNSNRSLVEIVTRVLNLGFKGLAGKGLTAGTCAGFLAVGFVALLLTPELSSERMRVQGMNAPCLSEFEFPEYPPLARHQGFQGIVRIRVTTDKDGLWTDIKRLEGNSVLESYAVEAIKNWKFCSCSQSPGEWVITFEFRLQGEKTNYWATTDLEFVSPATFRITANPPYMLVEETRE